jgi:precorrin-2/cobalt-factor-2 C20-methyltransferase
MKGTLYIVGVGPGDPELLTLKAARILEKCQIWLSPAASRNGASTALTIARGSVDLTGKEIMVRHFPMKKIRMRQAPDPEVQQAWEQAASWINSRLEAGHDVAFPTLGDPAMYCTGFYVYDTLLKLNPAAAIRVIPGISAIGATAAAAKTSLCLGDDKVVVIPAVFEDEKIREMLVQFEAVVFMKVHKAMSRLVPLLEGLDLLDNAVLVERTSMEDQQVHTDLKAIMDRKLPYFSTLIVRNKHSWLNSRNQQ